MKRHAFWVGAFALTAIALIVAGILSVGQTGWFSRNHQAVVYFGGSVKGLYVGAPVTFRGVKIGEVTRIGVEVDRQTLATRIPVELSLSTTDALRIEDRQDPDAPLDLRDLVQRGLRARMYIQSFVTGQMGVELDFRQDTPGTLQARGGKLPEIPTMQDKLDALITQVQQLPVADLMARMIRTLDSLDQTLQVTQRTLTTGGRDLTETAKQARETMATVSTVLKDLQGQTRQTLASVQQLADASRTTVEGVQPDLKATLERTRQAADSAQLAMSQLSELTAPGAPVRADLETALADLAQTSRSLRSFADQLDRQPNVLLFGGPKR